MTLRLLLVLTLCWALSACKEQDRPPAPAAKPTRSAAPDARKPVVERTGGAVEIGVPECDDYFRKYRACLKQIPPASRGAMERPLRETWLEWKKGVSQPGGKRELSRACRTASEAAAQAMRDWGCKW